MMFDGATLNEHIFSLRSDCVKHAETFVQNSHAKSKSDKTKTRYRLLLRSLRGELTKTLIKYNTLTYKSILNWENTYVKRKTSFCLCATELLVLSIELRLSKLNLDCTPTTGD